MAIINRFIKYALIVSDNSSSTDAPHERRCHVTSFDQTCSHPRIEPVDVSTNTA